ncbi:MAG: glutamine amidotransferase [Pseudomonadota bacterium]
MAQFFILQLRPEDEAADEEYEAFLSRGGLEALDVVRVRLDQEPAPSAEELSEASGVIMGGGPGCVSDPPEKKTPVEAKVEAAALSIMPTICERDIPYLGCCYGLGILTTHLGGRMGQEHYGEPVGGIDCALTDAGREDPLLSELPQSFRALVGHKEAVETTPDGAAHLVLSGDCPIQMIRYKSNIYGTQFHPEADGDSVATRIHIYRNHGYFPPEEADALIETVRHEKVTVPGEILRRFIRRYG